MKKGLKIAASALLVLAVLSGCTGTKDEDTREEISSGMAGADLFEDMKKGEAVDAKTVTEAFSDALDKTEAADSASIGTEVSIELTENDEKSSSRSITQIKYQPAENAADTEETTSVSEETTLAEDAVADETAEESPNRIAYVNIQNEYDGQSNTMEGYYENGYLYYTLEDNKVKEVMDYDDLMYIVGSYALQFNEDVVDVALKVTSNSETRYTIRFDSAAMAEMMISNMAGAGSPLGTDENMTINEAYMYFVVDNDGYLSGFDMELDAKFVSVADESVTEDNADTELTTEAQEGDEAADTVINESPFKYSVVANFRDINSTIVEAFEDLDSYKDVNEVLEQMQQEADEAAAQEEETVASE